MRHIKRLAIPAILKRKQAEWQRKFDEKKAKHPDARPSSNQYAHKDVRQQLMSMSHCKCFYCEGKLTDTPSEVDHYIEVAIEPSKAYEWTNLYLACTNCNNKISHESIAVTDALDPCTDSDKVIKDNITFRKEIICPVSGSPKGLNTITKFRLDTALLDAQRAKWLNVINETITDILKQMISEKRDKMKNDEILQLKQFMQPTSPFSLMSEIFIKSKLGDMLP